MGKSQDSSALRASVMSANAYSTANELYQRPEYHEAFVTVELGLQETGKRTGNAERECHDRQKYRPDVVGPVSDDV